MGESEWFVACDEGSGVPSQGHTKSEALSTLAETLDRHAEDVDTIREQQIDVGTAPSATAASRRV